MEALARDINIERANNDDFEALKQLLDKANDYSALRADGRRAWSHSQLAYADLERLVASDQCFVVRNADGQISSSISLGEYGPAWGETGKDGQALYFYKLLKDPTLAQSSEGVQLIGFGATEALRRQKPLLRCDTGTELTGLISYYRKLGFEAKGNFSYQPSGIEGVLLEAPAALILERMNV